MEIIVASSLIAITALKVVQTVRWEKKNNRK